MSLNVATRFASLIDNGLFEEASALLCDDCTYSYSEGKYQGRDHVIALYRTNTEFMRKTFDTVEFSSSVEALSTDRFKLNFTDTITFRGGQHRSRSYEIIQIEAGQIASIEHCDIAGEAEAMRAFVAMMRSR